MFEAEAKRTHPHRVDTPVLSKELGRCLEEMYEWCDCSEMRYPAIRDHHGHQEPGGAGELPSHYARFNFLHEKQSREFRERFAADSE